MRVSPPNEGWSIYAMRVGPSNKGGSIYEMRMGLYAEVLGMARWANPSGLVAWFPSSKVLMLIQGGCRLLGGG